MGLVADGFAPVPWWRWLLLSLLVTAGTTVLLLGALVALAFYGVDFTDYLLLPRPPFIQSVGVALWVALILTGQHLISLSAMALFAPTRALLAGSFALPRAPGGAVIRLVQGALWVLAVQYWWAGAAPPAPESSRMVEHLVYAITGRSPLLPAAILVGVLGIAIPVAEELLFRGVLFGYLRRRWGLLIASLGSAVLFGLAHGIASALPTVLLGLYLAWQRERDGSLLGPMLLHALNNLVALLVISASF